VTSPISVTWLAFVLACSTLQYEAKTFKPEPGAILEGTVVMVYEDGLLVNILDMQLLLIPRSSLNDYKFSESIQSFVHKDSLVFYHLF